MDEVRNVLYITYDGLTDPLGQSQILPYLQLLTQQGYRFTILSFEKPHRFAKEKDIIHALVQKAGIDWVPLTFTARPPVLAKAWDRYRMWQKAFSLHRKKQFDLVHCRSYVAAEVGLKLKQRFGVKFLFDMRGFWADEKVDNGQWNLDHPLFKAIYRQYKKKEKTFLLQADGVVSLTQAAKDYLLQQPGYAHLQIDVIPCCADLDHFNYETVGEAEKQALRKQLHIGSDTKLVTYLGSVGGWYMTREMFSFFKQLKQVQPCFKMLLLTKDDAAVVMQEATQLGIAPGDLIITYADRKGLPVYLSLSSFSLFFIRNSFSKKASSPTKHAELMGMGIPVVCNDIGDTGHIICQTATGLLVNEFDTPAFSAAVAQLDSLLQLDRVQIRSAARQFFDLKTGAARYARLYQHIFAN